MALQATTFARRCELVPVADTIGGITGAFAICGALCAGPAPVRVRSADLSMLDSVLATMGWVVSNYLIAGSYRSHGGTVPRRRPPHLQDGPWPSQYRGHQQEQFEARSAVSRIHCRFPFANRENRKKNRGALTVISNRRCGPHPPTSGR